MRSRRIPAPAVPAAERPELLRRAVAGDRAARDRLALSVWPIILRRAGQFAGRTEAAVAGLTADDLAQSAFARCLERLPRWNPGRGPLEAWAELESATAFGSLADRLRGRRRTSRAFIGRQEDAPDRAADAPGPLDSALSAERAGAVRAAVARLRPRDRALAERALMGGERQRAIAGAMGVTDGAVSKRLDRIRRDLRAALAFADS